jgi:GNAT superfamily N-acetyltransferase
MAISVRPAGLHDLPAVRRLLTHLDEAPAETAWSAARWSRMLDDPNRAVLLACDREEDPVGTADLLIVPNLTDDGPPSVNVEHIAIDPAWRSHGVGRTLERHAIRLAEDAGGSQLQLAATNRRVRLTTRSRRALSEPSGRRRPSGGRA